MQRQSDTTWLVQEFVDHAVIDNQADDTESHISIALRIDENNVTAALLSVESGPLLVFAAQNIEAAEENLLDYIRTDLEADNSRELSSQLAGGLFRIPLWPYLAVTKLPIGHLEIERSYRIQDYRKVYFPVSTFAASGDISRWEVTEKTADGASLLLVDGNGAGMGIVLEYIVEGNPADLIFELNPGASVGALYVDDNSGWTVTGQIESSVDVINELSRPISSRPDGVIYSHDHFFEDGAGAGRVLIASGAENIGAVEIAGQGTLPESGGIRHDPKSAVWQMIFLWCLFGILVGVGNLIYKFSHLPFFSLVLFSVGFYPLIALVSFLTLGYWGLGFVPASVLVSRFISRDGRRLTASCVVAGSVFFIMIISFVIIS